jgi:arabinose-5-phosphate isomerase
MSVVMTDPILKELFEKERSYLNHFFENLNLEEVDCVLKELLNCRGNIIVTGVGKSGLVAKKFAVTMISTGTKAIFLSPINALHGDIGIINNDDVFLILSKSGESDELLNLIPFVRNKEVKVISLVSNANSRLAISSDIVLNLPPERELCPFDMAPTTSTTIQGIIGDVLAIALMRLKNVSIEDFVRSHPAGRLGRRATVLVKDLMLKEEKIPFGKPEDKLVDSLVELSNKQCGCLIIADPNGTMLGIFTDGDLRRALQTYGVDALESTLEKLMTKNPRYTSPDVLAFEALKVMESNQKKPIMVLPVLDKEQKVVGVIKMHDLVQAGV